MSGFRDLSCLYEMKELLFLPILFLVAGNVDAPSDLEDTMDTVDYPIVISGDEKGFLNDLSAVWAFKKYQYHFIIRLFYPSGRASAEAVLNGMPD